MLQSSATVATTKDEQVSREGTQDVKTEDTGPRKLKVKVARSCLTLCTPMDYTVHGILQARILEWVAVPFSRGSS